MCAHNRPLSVSLCPALLVAAAGLLAAGCTTPTPGASRGDDRVVSSGLASLEDETPEAAPDDEIERMIAESASRLEQYFGQGPAAWAAKPETDPGADDDAPSTGDPGFSSLAALDEEPRSSRPEPAPSRPGTPAPAQSTADSASTSRAQPSTAPDRTAPRDPADVALADAYGIRAAPPKAQVRGGDGIDFLVALGADPDRGREARSGAPTSREELAQRLSESLRELVEDTSDPDEAYRAAAALAGLEALEPGAIDRISNTSTLTPEQLEVIRAAGEMARALGDPESRLDADRASELMGDLSQRLAAARGLRVTRATLCTRVRGFGRYEEFGSNIFLAGQSQPVIVYVEVDGFTSEPIPGGAEGTLHEVKLSQRLEMYHAVDGLNTWNRAAETDRTVSRNVLRDYYLINQVVLPPNLSVGKYVLKVVMRDLNSDRGAIDEALIPIEIVSDPSIAFPNNSRAAATP